MIVKFKHIIKIQHETDHSLKWSNDRQCSSRSSVLRRITPAWKLRVCDEQFPGVRPGQKGFVGDGLSFSDHAGKVQGLQAECTSKFLNVHVPGCFLRLWFWMRRTRSAQRSFRSNERSRTKTKAFSPSSIWSNKQWTNNNCCAGLTVSVGLNENCQIKQLRRTEFRSIMN